MLRSTLTFFWIMFFASAGAVAAGSMSSSDVATTLGTLGEGNRFNAIASLARSGQIRSPLSSSDGAAILLGTTQGARAAAIGELAFLFKTDLSGQEAEAILGPEATLSEGNRHNAIAALARAKRFGPSLGEDAALALKGATQGSRAAAIGEIAPYLRADLSGQAIATILGSGSLLSDGNRHNAIAAIARSGKKPVPLTGSDGAAILQGATQGARAAAIGELAFLFKTDLSGQEAEAILGPEATLSEGNRHNAIAALARAKRFGPSLGEDAALALKGATQGSRAAAIGEIAPYLRADLSGQAIATILGRNGELTEGNRKNAIAALARAGKLRSGLSGDEMNLILLGMSGQTRVSAITEVANAVKQNGVTPAPVGARQSTPPQPSSDISIGGAPFPSPTAGTTPTSVPAGPPSCSVLTGTEQNFCNLVQAVAAELTKAGIDQAKGWAFEKTFLELFKTLPSQIQVSLFSPGFLKEEFATQPFKKAATSYINSPSAVPLFLVDVFAGAVKEAYDTWAIKNYQDSPVTYALVQGYGDQMYVGLHASLASIASGQPEAGWMDAFIQESEITTLRLAKTYQYWTLLPKDRQAAVASIAQLILSATSASFAQQQGYGSSSSRVRPFSETAVATTVHQTVASSDIPSFDQVARLIYQAKLSYFASSIQSTTLYRTQSLAAIALAKNLDQQRPLLDKYWFTAFGSYEETTKTILQTLNLPVQ